MGLRLAAVCFVCLLWAGLAQPQTQKGDSQGTKPPTKSSTSKTPPKKNQTANPKPSAEKSVSFDLGLSGLTFQIPSVPPLVQHDEKEKMGELRVYHKKFSGLDWFGGSFVLDEGAKLDVVDQAKLNVGNVFRQLQLPLPASYYQNKEPLGKAESASVFGESLTAKGEVVAASRFVRLGQKVWYVVMSWKASDDKAAKLCLAIVGSARLSEK